MTSEAWEVRPGGELSGVVTVPGDKSISHRAIMLASLADGVSRINNFLEGEDCRATLAAFQNLGVEAQQPAPGQVEINGRGLDGLRAAPEDIDVGNSGTSIRLLCGICAGQAFDTRLTGDQSLRRRPMRRVTEPLQAMGALIETTDAGTAPLTVRGGAKLRGIDYAMPVASAQVKSSILLAGLYASSPTRVTEPRPSRDHTERMLRHFSYRVDSVGEAIELVGGDRLQAADVSVPADISSAAFFMVAAAIVPGSEVTLPGVGVNPTRTGIIDLLRRMGADVELGNPRIQSGEPVADIAVRGGTLRGIEIGPDDVPGAIDELPALFVAAACAEGQTIVRGAEELRVKESDRIAAMCNGLDRIGIVCRATPDGAIINGGKPDGGVIDSHGDHRIAMSFAVAGLRARNHIRIEDCANVATSFPGFVELARTHGLQLSSAEAA